MKPYNWMVQCTPQTNWIERRGIIIWLSIFSGILGGGAYFTSLIFNNLGGMFTSWLIVVVIKCGLHLAHAEKPLRLWRMILRPQTSWISRGLILTISLIVLGAVQLALTTWAPGTPVEIAFKMLAGIAAFGVMVYGGFALNYVSGIPFWNTSIMPVLFILWGILLGLAMLLVVDRGSANIQVAVAGTSVLTIGILVITTLHLWTETYKGSTARESVKKLIRGYIAPMFFIGTFVIGLVLPLIIILICYFNSSLPSLSLTVVMLVSEVLGGLAFTYCVMKVGLYNPLLAVRE